MERLKKAGIENNYQNFLLHKGKSCSTCRFKDKCIVFNNDETLQSNLTMIIVLRCPILIADWDITYDNKVCNKCRLNLKDYCVEHFWIGDRILTCKDLFNSLTVG